MRCLLVLLLMLSYASLHSQEQPHDYFNAGIGLGFDYGGIGTGLTYLPDPRIGLFGAAGYNLETFGWNAGAQWIIPAKKNHFFLAGMYGYNAVLAWNGHFI